MSQASAKVDAQLEISFDVELELKMLWLLAFDGGHICALAWLGIDWQCICRKFATSCCENDCGYVDCSIVVVNKNTNDEVVCKRRVCKCCSLQNIMRI